MNRPTIIRRRYIPDEVVNLVNDEVMYRDENVLHTSWKAIKPRNDIAGGISWTFLKEGYKISRFFDLQGNFLYWYCDMVDVDYDPVKDTYLIADLLVDLQIMSNGSVKVLDLDELAEAVEKQLITTEQACRSLRRLDALLKMLYDGTFPPGICRNSKDTNSDGSPAAGLYYK